MPIQKLSRATTVRAVRAAGPRPGGDALRAAYLDLLKLSLCDLAGARTDVVDATEEGRLFHRELDEDELQLRAQGLDWPLNGLTMVGLTRLDDLQRCVESIVADGVDGDLLEAGSWRGGASILIRATLDSLGGGDRTVWVADSFEGFPLSDPRHVPAFGEGDDMHGLEYLAVPVERVQAHFERFGCGQGVRFVPGFFEDTMPRLSGRQWSLVRLDADTYEATWLALEALYPGLAVGGYLIVDDYRALEACRQAVDDYRRECGIDEPLEDVDWSCVRWRRERGPEEMPAGPSPSREIRKGRQVRGTRPRAEARIPHRAELEMADELASVRERLAKAKAELRRLRGPRERLSDGVRRILGGRR